MPRFVLLEHDHPHRHWDFMLEAGAVLRTWRLAGPPEQPGAAIAAHALPDHRPLYLDYEGPVSGNRGTVIRWDAGTYDGEVTEQPTLRLHLRGTRVRGCVELRHDEGDEWTFEWIEGDDSREGEAPAEPAETAARQEPRPPGNTPRRPGDVNSHSA